MIFYMYMYMDLEYVRNNVTRASFRTITGVFYLGGFKWKCAPFEIIAGAICLLL